MKITLFGYAGSGTSTVGRLLAEKFDFPFMSTGNIFRSYAAEAGMSLYEFENIVSAGGDTSFDLKLDEGTKVYGEKHDKFVFESRLAWYFIPDSIKIYLKCGEEIRYKRILEREGGNIEEISTKNTQRETETNERYNALYPHIEFPPNDSQFDIIIDAETMLPAEIVEYIVSQI